MIYIHQSDGDAGGGGGGDGADAKLRHDAPRCL